MIEARAACLAAGGNRHPSAAAWDQAREFLAYGADCNVALWCPRLNESPDGTSPSDTRPHEPGELGDGLTRLLSGHKEQVNAICFCSSDAQPGNAVLISGSADGEIRVWGNGRSITESRSLSLHNKSVNAIVSLPSTGIFVSASADKTLGVWRLQPSNAADATDAKLLQQIKLSPSFIPLTISLAALPGSDSLVLAVAGTRTFIQIFSSSQASVEFSLVATLTGHEGWIRSLSFTTEDKTLLLASASQDKYIRLWRLQQSREESSTKPSDTPLAGLGSLTLSNKAHRFVVEAQVSYSITFEALLLGHEDWIFTAQWSQSNGKNRLLSASADNSLAIWELEKTSRVWICTVRLGEISAQKGATTATGSTGGFWIGLWLPDGKAVLSLGRTGSWRVWVYDGTADEWNQQVGITGHTRAVQGLAWSKDGSYLLTTGADQTTRVFAQWSEETRKGRWHEFSRAQIHGYDLKCIASIAPTQFVSGADEKLLRVFDQPKAVAEMLQRLSNAEGAATLNRPDVASIPVLGLSNKAIDSSADQEADPTENGAELSQTPEILSEVSSKPPTEDVLARHLLWPEIEKLYGHGYEIACVAASHSGGLIATACRASSIDHAVIRLYDTTTWRELKPVLTAHSLTVTALAFSPDDRFLLGVSRDRSFSVFEKRDTDEPSSYELREKMEKAHSRMILDCAWFPAPAGPAFATAGRDKAVHIWRAGESGPFERMATVPAAGPVTAIAVQRQQWSPDRGIALAYGLEDGSVSIVALDEKSLQPLREPYAIQEHLHPCKTVTALQWRPTRHETSDDSFSVQLAVASEDSSVRILEIFQPDST